MDEMCSAIGITSHIQQEVVLLLSDTKNGFMRSDLLRERLIRSLANGGYSTIFLSKINHEVDILVEQKLCLRQVKRGKHQIGLNKLVWKIPPETITLIHGATTTVTDGKLFADNFGDVVEDAKRQLRKMGVPRRLVNDAAFEILVARFLSSSP